MLVALGIGNPGDEYEGTRHNIGKDVVDSLIRRLRLRVSPGKGEYHYAASASKGLVLILPATYVNVTGQVAARALEQFGQVPGDLLVVCDDFSLPLGTLRLRPQGSDGGHKGLTSIIYELGTEAFGRLRIGIGPLPEGRDAADFVLSRFSAEESAAIDRACATAQEAILAVAYGGIANAMNLYNKKVENQGAEQDGDRDCRPT